MRLDLAKPEAAKARRAKLAEKLGGVPALIPAGAPRPRNYPATTYPFRASSHFLYFAGLPIENAMLLVNGGEHTLFVPPHDAQDELWHGKIASFDALAIASGCAVRSLAELPDTVRGRVIGTVPAVDLATRVTQEKLLNRALDTLGDEDEALADAIIALRLIHDADAIAGLREAADATKAAHVAGMKATRAGLLEAEVCAAMEHEVARRGMTTAYGSIVTVHGEVLHNDAHHHRLSDGDLLLADVGAETASGWAGDVTRTWPVSGAFSGPQRAIYEVVLAAQEAAIACVAPGARYRDVHLVASKAIATGLVDLGVLSGDPAELVADGVHALFFPHGVGHLIGLDVHDMEDLGDHAGYAAGRMRSSQFGLSYLRLDRDLAPGMAVTIEPGFYQVPAILRDEKLCAVAKGRLDRAALARFADVRGIRIEDDVLVTKTGREVLTAGIPKTVSEVEAAVGA